MEVMAEANEQPALLNQDVDDVKKPRRTKAAASPRRTAASKTGARRSKKQPTDQAEPRSDLNNHQPLLDVQVDAPSPKIASPNVAVVSERTTHTREIAEPAKRSNDQKGSELSEPVEAPVSSAPATARYQETPPAVEAPRYDPVFGEGLIEVSGKGFGFLRDPKRNYVQSPQDIFVTPEVVRKHALRDGLWIKGEVRRGSRGPQLFKLLLINGEDPDKYRNLPVFEELTSINPLERIRLETVPDRYTTRVMDLMTPIGKGQRGLIVAPPRTGKTTLLQHIADAVVRNHPEMKLIILLVDERPEEVTEIRRTVPKADIMASSNDSDIKSHTRIAQLAIERAKRLVEAGKDVFVLMDSLTRVGRAFNNAISVPWKFRASFLPLREILKKRVRSRSWRRP